MSTIQLVNVGKRYAEGVTPALTGIHQTIADGEFFVLVGPSGCGKSTLLKLLAGLDDPTEGEIYIDERLCNFVEPRDRNIALVFQNYALYPQMTAEQNVRFPLKMARVRGEDADRAVREATTALGLQPLLHRNVSQLSGGERQRVALARAIVRRPSVTLMDEPLSNLDALLRAQTREELLSLHQRVPGTVVYVTHDQVEAMTMGDRIGVMDGGRLVQVGTPMELYEKPRSRFVAGFLGSPQMNFISGTLEQAGDELVFRTSDMTLPLAATIRLGLVRRGARHGSVTLGVRAENVHIRSAGDGEPPWMVDMLEYLGTEYIVTLRRGSTRLRARSIPRSRPDVGDTVGVAIEALGVHVFGDDGVNLVCDVDRSVESPATSFA